MTQSLPELVLLGASMIEWSFDEATEGLGWFLERKYQGKARIVNEGRYFPIIFTRGLRAPR